MRTIKEERDVLFNPVHTKYDCSLAGRFHWEDDLWAPRPTVMEHDHCLLQSQAVSRAATDDGKFFMVEKLRYCLKTSIQSTLIALGPNEIGS